MNFASRFRLAMVVLIPLGAISLGLVPALAQSPAPSPAASATPSPAPSATPADKIGVPAADRLLLERVRFTSPTYEASGPNSG